MINLLALYRGRSFADAQLIAVSSNEELCATFAETLLAINHASGDEVIAALNSGRKEALQQIVAEHDARQEGGR